MMKEQIPLVRFENVTYVNEQKNIAVFDINFQLMKGDNIVFLGPEGCGNNLILQLITRKIKPNNGIVCFNGKNISQMSEDEIVILRSQIGFIPVEFGLINNYSVVDNIILPLKYHTKLKEHEMIKKAEFFMKKYHIMHKKNARPQELTHSEKLRTAFIRALIMDAQLILMEDPLFSQCPLATSQMIKLAEEDFQKRHLSFILTSFFPDFFREYTDHYILIYKGEIVFDGDKELWEESDNEYVVQYRNKNISGPMESFYSGIHKESVVK